MGTSNELKYMLDKQDTTELFSVQVHTMGLRDDTLQINTSLIMYLHLFQRNQCSLKAQLAAAGEIARSFKSLQLKPEDRGVR